MRAWTLALPVDRDDPAPVVRQIARAIAAHVGAGRLRPGERLPGTRALSRVLDVHRNTVAAAYAELAAEGWVDSAAGRGTFVSAEIPAPPAPRAPVAGAVGATRTGYDLPPGPRPPRARPRARGTIDLEGGIPDLRLVPAAELARAYRRALRRPGILGYADPRGQPALRAALGAMLRSTRGLDPDPDRLLVARGSQHAIALAARALVRPGDAVAVEALGYPAAWEAFRAAGARLVPSRSTGTGSASTRWRRPRAGSRCARSTSRRTTSTRPPRRSPPAGGSRSSASRRPRGSRSSRTTSTASSTTTAGRCCRSRRATRPAWSCTWGRSRRCSRPGSGSATCTRPWS